VRAAPERDETIGNRVHDFVGNLDAAALSCDIKPDVIQFNIDFLCNAVRH
jgi:hypothetical protein